MIPPWEALPHIPKGMGWNMGQGQDYKLRFYDWFLNLSFEERKEFKLNNPPPDTWSSFYDGKMGD